MGRWDRSFKVLGRLRPLDLLRLVPGVQAAGASASSLEKELASAPPLPRSFDLFLELRDAHGHEQAFQIEAEARPRSDTGKRVFGRWSYAHLVLGRPVECVVFYLMRALDGRRPQESYSASNATSSVDFHFSVVCLWRLKAETLLQNEAPGLWPLVSLAAESGRGHIQRACKLIEGLGDERLVSELLGVWYEVAGVKLGSPDLQAMVSKKELLVESSTYKAIREEGRQEGERLGEARGERRGEQRGRREELSKACRKLVEAKLGRIPSEASTLDRISDLEELSRLEDRLIRAASPSDVLEVLRSLER